MKRSPAEFQRILFLFLAIFMISFFYPDDHAHARRIYSETTEEEVRPFNLQFLNGALDFRFEYEDDRQEGLKQRRSRFEERLDLDTRGSIYHPNLLEFNIGTSFGLGQEWYRGDFNDYINAYPYEYDINLNFLKLKPYSFTLFANRSSTLNSRQFFEPIKVDNDLYGGEFRFQNKLFPVTLRLQSQNTKEDSFDFKRDRAEKSADLRISNQLGDFFRSEFRYIYKGLMEENPAIQGEIESKQEITSHDFSLSSRLDYNKIHGNSNISYLETSGILKTDQLRINENVYIDHTKTFTTLYNYNFSRYATGNFMSNINQGSIGCRHKLYESLVTEVKGDASLTNGTDFKESLYGPSVSLSYRKNVPGGVFSAGYNFFYHRTDREATDAMINVFGERIILTDTNRTFLANPDVILSSVIVRDTFGAILTLNIDYRLIPSGNLTEIQRVALPDNTPVLVDYEFSSPQSLKYDTVNNGINLRYDFKQLFSLYYSYLDTAYKGITYTSAPTAASPLNNIRKSLYGAELRWRWFSITGEYEDDNSDLNPFQALRFRGSFTVSPTDNAHLGINAGHSRTDYEKEGDTFTIDTVDAFLRLRLNSYLEASLSPGYLRQRGRDTDIRAFRVKGDLRGQYRAIEWKLESEYLNRREMAQDRNELLVRFNLIRRFNIF